MGTRDEKALGIVDMDGPLPLLNAIDRQARGLTSRAIQLSARKVWSSRRRFEQGKNTRARSNL